MNHAGLRPEQITRYRRHLVLPEFGPQAQQRLLASKVLCIGVGGLGCPASVYLAAAGVGTLGLVDVDIVSPSNLQRQILFDTNCIGQPKTEVARQRLQALNPDVTVNLHQTIAGPENILDLISGYDLVIDGTDNFPTRYCVNDACVLLRKPNVYGSVFRFEGMVSVFAPHLSVGGEPGPCYRCIFPDPPDPGTVPSCAEGGVLGILPGTIGTLQATEAIKLLAGIGQPAVGRLLTFDALSTDFRVFRIGRNPLCPVCGENPRITAPIDYEQFCGVPVIDPASQEEIQAEVRKNMSESAPDPQLDERGLPPGYAFKPDWEVTPRQVKQMLDESSDFLLLDCRMPNEWQITHIEGAKLLPLQQLQARMNELVEHKNRKIVVHCRSGGRSLQFAQVLRQQGFTDVTSMAGGILLWNKDIRPGGPQY
jgi:adenylyltransferase/sulfurtransferase